MVTNQLTTLKYIYNITHIHYYVIYIHNIIYICLQLNLSVV